MLVRAHNLNPTAAPTPSRAENALVSKEAYIKNHFSAKTTPY
jgi:hypothetical protein